MVVLLNDSFHIVRVRIADFYGVLVEDFEALVLVSERVQVNPDN